MINNVVLMGRLVADPELRTTANGTDVCSFRIAVDRNYVSQGQERQADFIPCVAWRQTAKFISQWFSKGSMIALTGSIQTRTYEDNNGNKRNAFDVVVDQASFTGSKAESGSAPKPVEVAKPVYNNTTANDFEIISDDEDLPF